MKNKKLIAIPITMVATLLLIGFVYAHWSETLMINGTVNTSELDWEFVSGSIIHKDPADPATNDWNCDPGFDDVHQIGKNVGYTTCELVDTDNDGDLDTMKVTLENVYPCYYEHIAFEVHNNGKIPLKIWKVVINGHEFYGLPIYIKLDLNNDGKDDIEMTWGDNFGQQMEPCDTVDISFKIHVLQGAPQGASLSFTIQLIAIQWNEYYVP